MTHAFGWNAQRPDARDHQYLPAVERQDLAASHELDFAHVPVLDQGQLGSCTANGAAACVMYDQTTVYVDVVPSRLFIYWNSRHLEGTTSSDAGATVRDAVKVLATLGAPPETDWPYSDANPGPFTHKPPAKAYTDAVKQEALNYAAVRYGYIRQTIQSGFPVIFGFTVYDSFETEAVAASASGLVPMPAPGESVLGGHCVVATGFNSSDPHSSIPLGHVRFRNSWSKDWGHDGDGYLPFKYFNSGLTSDYWVVRSTGPKA